VAEDRHRLDPGVRLRSQRQVPVRRNQMASTVTVFAVDAGPAS
jgi:hypothetical protein